MTLGVSQNGALTINNSHQKMEVVTEIEDIPEAFRITNYNELRRLASSNLIRSKDGTNIFLRITNSMVFLIISTMMIVGNTIVLALDRYPLSTSESDKLDLANTIFTIGFVFEMIIKIFAVGIK